MPLDIHKIANEFVGRKMGGNKEIKCSGVRLSKAGQKVNISSQGLNATITEEDGTVKSTNVGGGVMKTIDLNVDGNLTCKDLTVLGSNTKIESKKIIATDPIIQIGYNTTTTPILHTEFGNHDRGLDMLFSKNNGNSLTTSRAFLGLDVSDPPKFVIKIEDNIDVDTHPNTFSGSFANFKAKNIEATGTLDVTGDTTVTTFDSTGATSLATGGGAVNISKLGDMTTVLGTLNVTGATNLNDTSQSNDKDTGALIVDGGVGIEKNLNVGSAINAQEITIGSNNGNDKNRLRIDYNSTYKNTFIDYGTIQSDNTGGNLYIRSATTSDNTTRLTILANGNVGIGNSHNPSVLLDVFDKNYDDNDQYRELAKFSMTNDSNDSTYQRLFIGQWNRQKNMFIQVKKQENSQDIVGSLILQPYGGRVGIGAVPADTKLHVSVGMNLFDAGGTIPIAKFHARNNNTYDSYLTIEETT